MLTPEEKLDRLAETLHDRLCRWPHSPMADSEYPVCQGRMGHPHYKHIAERMVDLCSVEDALYFVEKVTVPPVHTLYEDGRDEWR